MKAICVLLLVSLFGFAIPSPAAEISERRDLKAQVVCKRGSRGGYFDVKVSLTDLPGNISPKAFLDLVADQTASSYTPEWIGYLSIYRWSVEEQKYLGVEQRIRLREAKPFLDKVKDGDLLVFHGQVCYF